MDTAPEAAPDPAAPTGPGATGVDEPLLVVCVVYHPGDELLAFQDSLARATTRPVDLVLVDNGRPNPCVDEAVRRGARLLPAGRNLGYGAAANLGAREGSGEWLVVANPDLVWAPGSLDHLLAAGDALPEAGALGPALLNPDGSPYPSARAIPSLRQGAGHALLGRIWPGNPWSVAYRREHESGEQRERAAGWLSGACLLLRRRAFEQVGGFDEAYFMFFEDLDLGERLGRAGWRNAFAPQARVTHLQGASWKARPEPMIRAHHASARLYLERRYHRPLQWPVRAAVRLGLSLRERVEVRRAARRPSSR